MVIHGHSHSYAFYGLDILCKACLCLILDVQAGPAVPKTSMYVYSCVHLYKYLNSLALYVRLGMVGHLTI